ncbi:MAG: hemerythrin domain-containing protein [Candidatus Heimdallarchaeota archaeon]|nr:hemerythrin domain-containing protein [Candidatus Heimdallarchaeota archaeon]
MVLRWNNMLKTGVTEIDLQHRQLIKDLNNVGDLLKGNNEQSILDALSDVFSFTETHFATEEKILTVENHPELENHRNLHIELLDVIQGVTNHYKETKSIPELKTNLKLINNATLKHIQNYDIPLFKK